MMADWKIKAALVFLACSILVSLTSAVANMMRATPGKEKIEACTTLFIGAKGESTNNEVRL